MKLQALYDLKERLEYAAIAGTGLLQEDFRLRRAVDALASLAAANPVFARINVSSKALLSAPQAERSTRLLDLLSLVDAVVYTQGVTNVNGDLEPLPGGNGKYVQASYGELQPLLTALTGSGTGRTSVIQRYWKEHPDYFADFRMLPHVVSALGDPYGELAELIFAILMKQGTSIIPQLKEGFDPAGKTEMVRRVRLIAKLSGAAENDWFVSILPEAKKDVREAVIQALSLSQDNVQLLLDLCRSERGKLKEAALRSLAMMEDDACIEFWKKEAAKRPDAVYCLSGVDSTLAADLTAEVFHSLLKEILNCGSDYDGATLTRLCRMIDVITGKYSSGIDKLWHWIAAQMDVFSGIRPQKNVFGDYSVAEYLQRCMMETILCNSDVLVLNTARSLSRECRPWFLCCEFLADMAELPAAALYEKYASCIVMTGLVKKETEGQRNERIQIMRAMAAVSWNDEEDAYCATFRCSDPLTGEKIDSVRKLDGFDSRWAALLSDARTLKDGDILIFSSISGRCNLDQLLISMINPHDSEVCTAIGNYLYERACKTGMMSPYFSGMVRCNWTRWSGLMTKCVKQIGELRYDHVVQYLDQIPMSNAQKAAELRQLDEIAGRRKVKIWMNYWPSDRIRLLIAKLEANPTAEILSKL